MLTHGAYNDMHGMLLGQRAPYHTTEMSTSAVSNPRLSRLRIRRVRNGTPTNDLVFSASVERNDEVFVRILRLYLAPGSLVADVTYGKGAFWRKVSSGLYEVRATDLRTGVDCRDLPYGDGEIDCVVLASYMHSPGGPAHMAHRAFERHYRNNGTGNRTRSKYHEAIVSLYVDAGVEAYKVLRNQDQAN